MYNYTWMTDYDYINLYPDYIKEHEDVTWHVVFLEKYNKWFAVPYVCDEAEEFDFLQEECLKLKLREFYNHDGHPTYMYEDFFYTSDWNIAENMAKLLNYSIGTI